MGHIRDMAVKRADSLQFETVELRSQVDTVSKLLSNTKLPGSLDQQVCVLLMLYFSQKLYRRTLIHKNVLIKFLKNRVVWPLFLIIARV